MSSQENTTGFGFIDMGGATNNPLPPTINNSGSGAHHKSKLTTKESSKAGNQSLNISSTRALGLSLHHLTDEDVERLEVVYNDIQGESETSPAICQVQELFWKLYPNICARHVWGETVEEVEKEIEKWVDAKNGTK
jgi:hypothetical protein